MQNYRFSYPIQIRYSDLDPQWHVNNARTASFLEQARFAYLVELGLFDGKSFFDLGLIVADVHVVYLAPITLGQNIRVELRTAKIGNKSLTLDNQIVDTDSGQVLVRGETVMVAYDYRAQASMRVPQNWRDTLYEYEIVKPIL